MKRNAILVVIFFVLMAGYLFFRAAPRTVEFTPPSDYKVVEWGSESVNRIELTSPASEEKISLTKEGTDWLANGFLADQERIAQLFEGFESAQVVSRVSTNPQNHSQFEVGDQGTLMTLFASDNEVQTMILGKSAGGMNLYSRIPEQDAVYVLEGLAAHLISDELAIWRERKLIGFDANEIKSVRLDGGFDWDLSNTTEGWFLSSGRSSESISETNVITWLESMVVLSATDFKAKDAPNARLLSTVTVEEGSAESVVSTLVLNIYRSDETSKYFAQDQQGNSYLILEGTFDDIFISYGDLLEKLTVEFAPTE
jgi:hypothetical protein